ncbi:MAG: hypothetical protein ABSC94_22435 [Polyangiaceae bacterium]|jgi:hypothetical protein
MLVPAIAFSWWLSSLALTAPVEPIEVDVADLPRATRKPNHIERPTLNEGQAVAANAGEADPGAAGAVEEQAAPEEDEPSEADGERVPYRGLITPEIARVARTFLDLPLGSERVADVEDHRFVFVLERHYHPPGFVGAPTGWHKGVTVYEIR